MPVAAAAGLGVAAFTTIGSAANNVAEKTGLLGYIGNQADYARNNKKYFRDALSKVETVVTIASVLLDDCPSDRRFDRECGDWLRRVVELIRDSSHIAKNVPGKWTVVSSYIDEFSANGNCRPTQHTVLPAGSVSNCIESVHRIDRALLRAAFIGEKSKDLINRANALEEEYNKKLKQSYQDKTLYQKKPCSYLQAQTEINTLVSTASQLLDKCPKDSGFGETSFDWLIRVMQVIDEFESSEITTAIPAQWSRLKQNIAQFNESSRYKPAAYIAASSAPHLEPLVRRDRATNLQVELICRDLASKAENLTKEYNENWKKYFDAKTLYEKKRCAHLPSQTKMNTLVSAASKLLNDCPVDGGFDDMPFDWLIQVMQLITDFESSQIATEIPAAWSFLRENINQFSKNSMYKPEEYVEVNSAQIYQPLVRNSEATDEEMETKSERLSIQAERLKKEYDDKLEKEHKAKILFKKRPRCQLPAETNGVKFMHFKCRSETMNKVFRSLSEQHITQIYGPGGIGKTVILAEIAKKAQNDSMFNRVVYAKVSRDLNVIAIQDTIANQLGMSLQLEDRTRRSIELKQNIEGLGKVLVILDDVWEDAKITETLGIPTIQEVKVLVGTRRRDFPLTGANKIRIDLLSHEDSWLLLRQEAPVVDDYNIKTFAGLVQAECCGLPLAIAVIGKALSGKEAAEWKRAVDYLKNSLPADIEGVEADLYKIIKYSYDHLPPHKEGITRKVFLSCCLFPESEEVRQIDLLRYLYEEEDVKRYLAKQVNANLLTKVSQSVDTLEHHGLLQKSTRTRGIVKMHDVVRDVAVYIAREEEYAYIICGATFEKPELNKKTLKSSTRISLSNIAAPHDKPDCPNLQTLLIRGDAVLSLFPNKIERSLTVLDLSRSGISKLPASMKKLTNVRTLLLNGCKKLIDVAVVVKLTGLQVLSLRESVVKSLPENMKDLLNLIVLDWENSLPAENTDTKITQEHIKAMCKLKELSMDSKSITDGAFLEITKLKHLNAVKLYVTNSALSSSKIFADKNRCTWDKFTIYNHVGSPMLSEEKNFNLSIEHLQDVTRGVRVLLRKSEEVVIKNCFENATLSESTNGCTDTGLVLTEATGEGTFKETSILRVMDCANISYVTSEDGVAFTELEEMELARLKKLIGIFKPQKGAASMIFGKVRKISVNSCDDLIYVIPNDVLQMVHKTLEKISVSNSKKVQCIFYPEEDFSSSLSALKSILLDNLDTLNCICHVIPRQGIFQNLEELFIRKCRNFTSLFTTHVAAQLNNLQKLTVEDNSGLTEIVSTDGTNTLSSIQAFPSVSSSEITTHPEGVLPQGTFQNLKEFNVRNCNKITRLFTTHLVAMLTNLQKLTVEDNRELKEIVTSNCNTPLSAQAFPRVNHISLQRLPQLEHFNSCTVNLHWPALLQLNMKDCPALTRHPYGRGSAPHMKRIDRWP